MSAIESDDSVDFLGLLSEPKRRAVLAGSRGVRYQEGTEEYIPQLPDFAVVVQKGLFRMYVGGARTAGGIATQASI